ncbi:hypothetical protein [Streptococcus uberis]|uniref:hypothetical protein n=1 Tax=Streptococcus uberis TaxID=1349 RepID=UPI0019399B0E|nr:hypothetical protein [Streptococcus uberis]
MGVQGITDELINRYIEYTDKYVIEKKFTEGKCHICGKFLDEVKLPIGIEKSICCNNCRDVLFEQILQIEKEGLFFESGISDYFSEMSDLDIDFYELQQFDPPVDTFDNRDHHLQRYNDKYVTDEGYKLRELLVLVWWGNKKKGNLDNIKIPKYFFQQYSLNFTKVTNKFIKDGLLITVEDNLKLTDKGKMIYNKYKTLWEIHSFNIRSQYTLLDRDFPYWDNNEFTIACLKREIEYFTKYLEHHIKLLAFCKNNQYPEDEVEREEYITNYERQIKSEKAIIQDYRNKIEALQ